MSDQNMQNSIVDLQTRLAFQESMIEDINLAVVKQQLEIDLLKREIIQLKETLEDYNDSQVEAAGATELPPHY